MNTCAPRTEYWYATNSGVAPGCCERCGGYGVVCLNGRQFLCWDHYCEEINQSKVVVKVQQAMKTFIMYRRNVPDLTHNTNQKNAADQPQFEGVVFSDGSVAIRWLTSRRSTAVWASMEDMLAIHGHPEYGSELVWTSP